MIVKSQKIDFFKAKAKRKLKMFKKNNLHHLANQMIYYRLKIRHKRIKEEHKSNRMALKEDKS